jgi:hypothetical protein
MDWLRQLMRVPYARGLWARYPVGSLETRVLYGIHERPHYAYGLYWSAFLASALGLAGITAIEFGVAGGTGLLALEALALEIGRALGIAIEVVGFDSGKGMPPPVDYRDLPHIWAAGFYGMDEKKLRARLSRAQLVLGDVGVTVEQWLRTGLKHPVGFVAFDLDYYSSTVAALKIFDGARETHLPRVHCYFDDLAGNNLSCMNPYVGEHLAIAEFNASHPDRKVCLIEQLYNSRTRWEDWIERMYAFHDFSHPDYNKLVIPNKPQHTVRPL